MKDFDYLASGKCMEGATSRVLDSIYNKWPIGLTIHVRQGGQSILWPSKLGEYAHHEEDENIYKPLCDGLRSIAGTNPLVAMEKLSCGKLALVFDFRARAGRFEDWARFRTND